LDGWVQLIEPMSATRLYVDQAAIESNMAAFRRLIGPRTRLLGVVKAHAYGTNPTEVAHLLQESGADWLGVATADEGLALRRNGILNIPILVLLPQPNEIERIAARQLTPLVYSHDLLEAAIAHSHRSRRPLRIHLEVDSGMHRTGLAPEAAVAALYRIRQEEWLRLEGLMTHLGCADDPSEDALTLSQLARFGKVSGAVDELGLQHNDSGPVIRHACATAATIRFPQAHFDMVRVGIGLYGIHLSPATRAGLSSLTPALTLVSRVIEVHTLEQGERVGYGGHYAAPRDGTRVGVVPAGYFDCVPRAFTKVGRVWVDGEEAPIIGTVSMDSMTIDLSDIPTAGVGSDVLIYGHHSGASMPIEAAAERIGTAPYELLTRIGPRVQRVFTRH
jgi:Alr-MurF fusion protein